MHAHTTVELGAAQRAWLEGFVRECQVLSGTIGAPDASAGLARLLRLLRMMPESSSPAVRLVVIDIVAQVARRLSSLSAPVDARLAQLVAEGSRKWSTERLGTELANLLETPSRSPAEQPDDRVARVLRLIRRLHQDQSFSLSQAANAVNLSRWHVSRMLKAHTGRGFIAHLHETRVESAIALLVDQPLSVKEVAAAVGYSSTAQLDRHIRRICGTSPKAIRMTCARTHTATADHK